MRTFSVLALMAGMVVFSGCAESGTDTVDTAAANTEPAATLANEICPIMGKPVKDGGGTAEWNGKTIGFCCPGCIDKWEALSEEEKTTKLSADATASTDSCCSEGSASCCGKEGDDAKTCCKECSEAKACCKDGEKGAACCKDGEKKSAEGAAVTFVNENCPIMGQPVKAGGGSVEWNGKMVGFCCPGCIKKWDALSNDAKATKLTEAIPQKDETGA